MTERSSPMPVKHWSFAGLMLTYWCSARCECCYLSCNESRPMREPLAISQTGTVQTEIDYWLGVWEGLISTSPHGCLVHITGGEPFGDWPRLIELARQAHKQGLAPLEKVETNAFWATDPAQVRDRLAALRDAGMEKIAISADPYHQQFVPIERCRLLANCAQEVLGEQGVQVRWRDWLADGFDTHDLTDQARRELFAGYLTRGRERLGGRAAGALAGMTQLKSLSGFSDNPCRDTLLRGRHVHVDSQGNVMPGTCAGIVLGRLRVGADIKILWQNLNDNRATRPILSELVQNGPFGLLDMARQCGFAPAEGYASKCHLCWDIRRALAKAGVGLSELGPMWMYVEEAT